MKRSASRPQTLKHLPFFEVLANAPEGSEEAKLATAGLLSLRMIDHWVLAGPAIVEPESVSVRSVRRAIMALPPKEPVRESLLTIVNTMQMLRQVDLIPVLPRVFAYAQLLERHHGAFALAADAYESVIRLADAECDADMVMDSYQRLAVCQRRAGALDDAFESSRTLVKLATRRKDRARALRGKIGLGVVTMMRGDLPGADSHFVAVTTEATRFALTSELAMATHNRSVVASRSGDQAAATVLAHAALKQTTDPVERDRVLADLAAYLIRLEQYEAAADALRILEVTAVTDEPRKNARVNLLIVAARTGNRRMFDGMRSELAGASLTVEAQVNLLIETARGLDAFGNSAEASQLLAEAEVTADQHRLGRSIIEIAQIRSGEIVPVPALSAPRAAIRENGPTLDVASDLRRMAEALASVG